MRVHVRDRGRTFVLGPREEGPEPAAGEVLTRPRSAADADWLVRSWVRDPENTRSIRRLLAASGATSVDRLDDAAVLAHVARLWTLGRLWIVAAPVPALPAFDTDEEEEITPVRFVAPVREEPRIEKTWIEIELLDDKGKPVSGERYRIKLTDGNTYPGQLDPWGRARHTGLDPGQCAVWFPDLSGKRWDVSATAAGEDADEPQNGGPRGPKRTWIELELLNEDGTPAAGEVYEITLPDGEVFRGKLDEEGTAFHGDIDPGECSVTFPRLEPREWEKA